jgi:hypothetical protein
MQLSRDKCTYWGIGWQNDLSHRRQLVLSSLGPLNILISSSRDLEIVGVLNHLTLWGRKSLSN